MVVGEIAMRPARSPRIVAIGASSTGGRATARPGSARRKLFTQATSGNRRITCRNASRMPITSTRDDQRVEARIGHEGDDDLLVQHDHDEAAQDQEHQHPDQEDPG